LAQRFLFGVCAVGLALVVFRMRFVHALSLRNRSDSPVQATCGPFVHVTLNPKDDLHFSYSLIGRSFTCVFKSSAGETTCSRALRGFEDAYVTVSSTSQADCHDY
jgi:hypothetical protein